MGSVARIGLAGVIVALMLPVSALGAYPGNEGKIAFERDGQIWTIIADGTVAQQLTSAAQPSTEPEWSPDGTRIAYTRGTGSFQSEVRVMNADGSGDALVRGGGFSFSPTWSPDGTRIAFVEQEPVSMICSCAPNRLMDANPDGTQPRTIAAAYVDIEFDYSYMFRQPEWSPRGDEIVLRTQEGFPYQDEEGYHDLDQVIARFGTGPSSYASFGSFDDPHWSPAADKLALARPYGPDASIANPDGTGLSSVPNTEGASEIDWSPTGTRLVYAAREPTCFNSSGPCPHDLWLVDPDGGNRVRLTTTAASEHTPDWQPVVTGTPPGYPRPKGASPLRVSLVPAYTACSSGNTTHGPPLAFTSCTPPTPRTSRLTIGTPDANGAPANMVGYARFDTVTGNPATPADEADVALKFQVTDVRCASQIVGSTLCSEPNESGGPDYVGNVSLRVSLRPTDMYNLPAPGGRNAATGTDRLLTLDAPCFDADDFGAGSVCGAQTSMDAVIPGLAIEGRRLTVSFSEVEVGDGGSGVFLRQGVFIP